jgi:fructose-1,6-bisphosphatase I/sedoheptulose-1,7-bisphosphatase
MHSEMTTLTEFLIDQRRAHPEATGDLNALILNVALVCRKISAALAAGNLQGLHGSATNVNVQGEEQKKLDVLSNELFLHGNESGGHLAGMVSEEMESFYPIPPQYPRGKYLLVFDPLDGSSNIDINVSVGSIFSILRAPRNKSALEEADFLQAGVSQVCAGYAFYGPSTMLVMTVGTGVYGFTLDPQLGEFFLTHPALRIPEQTSEFAINASNARFWGHPVRRYVEECQAGKNGSRGKDFNMRWIASMVADAHRILMRGGCFLYPQDNREPARAGRLRLLYEANPVAFLIEQAGGRASTGTLRILDLQPSHIHERIGLIFGSAAEVARVEEYHHEGNEGAPQQPLFREHGLFRVSA